MTHPNVLLATAAAWSLRRSWYRLLHTATSHADDDGGHLQAWRPGSGVRSGGPGDGLAGTILRTVGGRAQHTQLSDQVATLVDESYWLLLSALRKQEPAVGAPLALITYGLPAVDPATAVEIGRRLTRADQAVRRALRTPPDHWALPSAPECPACGTRLLRAVVSAPDTRDWIVVCTAGCRCLGDTCNCGMTIRPVGVDHVWDARSPVVAAELGRLPRRRTRSRKMAA